MSVAQGCVFGLNSSQKGSINMCLKVNCYKNMDILRIMVADRIIA